MKHLLSLCIHCWYLVSFSPSNALAVVYRPLCSATLWKANVIRKDVEDSKKPNHHIWKPFTGKFNNRLYITKVKSSSDNSGSGGTVNSDSVTTFEKLIRTVTRNEKYKFGDLSKKTITTTTKVVEDVVKKTTGNEDYRFGDLTRGTVAATTTIVEEVVKQSTGKDYKFGDLTKGTLKAGSNALTVSEMTLSLVRDANINELVALSRYFWTINMDAAQRKEVFVVVVYLGGIIVLAYNLVANINAGLVNAAAWSIASVQLNNSPLKVQGGWNTFLQAKHSLNMIFGGPFLPARVAITIPIFFQYQRWIRALQRKLPFQKFPIANRVSSLVTMWLGVNFMTYLSVSIGFAWIGSLVSRIPLK